MVIEFGTAIYRFAHNCPIENTGQLGLTTNIQHTPIHINILRLPVDIRLLTYGK